MEDSAAPDDDATIASAMGIEKPSRATPTTGPSAYAEDTVAHRTAAATGTLGPNGSTSYVCESSAAVTNTAVGEYSAATPVTTNTNTTAVANITAAKPSAASGATINSAVTPHAAAALHSAATNSAVALHSAATNTAVVEIPANAERSSAANIRAKTAVAAINSSLGYESSAAASIPDGFNSLASDTSSAALHNITGNALDQQLRELRKKRELLELQKQIYELENSIGRPTGCRASFADIEHAVPKFTGDNSTRSVHRFFEDFEEIMRTVNADDQFKLLSLRRSLQGTARVFLTTTSALNYRDLKKAVIEEFDSAVSRQDVYRTLTERKWKHLEESLHCYILTMQSLAKQGGIRETDVIDLILDGIGNKINNINLLMPAQSTVSRLPINKLPPF
ncbi:uncharacterized protein LOC118757077 [Rhagoletis pomonella]|uniref:uncharacterized protein LOC118757077 n=1 Tax=Rhagoletis pomonella TaxID=28610 RepID=UPI00178648B2|nr:uncharacterized protein LOC118757077 [Rhagoletis pomonella]